MKIVDYETREEWRGALRSDLRLGSTDPAKLLGVSRFGGPYSVWWSLVGPGAEAGPASEDETDDEEETDDEAPPAAGATPKDDVLIFGEEIEPAIARMYSRRNPTATVRRLGRFASMLSESRPWLRSSPDFVVEAPGRARGVLEAKSVDPRVWLDLWTVEDAEEGGRVYEVPLEYVVQAHAHVLASDGWVEWVVVAALVGRRLRTFEVPIRPALVEAIDEACLDFFARYVDGGEVPDPDPSPGSLAAVRAATLEVVEGREIALDERFVAVARDLLEARAAKKAAAERARFASARLLAALGDAEVGILPGGGRVRASRTDRAENTVRQPATSYRVVRPSFPKSPRTRP